MVHGLATIRRMNADACGESVAPNARQGFDEMVEELRAAGGDAWDAASDVDATEPQGTHDAVNHPTHYTSHPSGIECIDVTEHYGFSIGNAIKYLWRAGLKGDATEDLKKARWYIDREIQKRTTAGKK